jgi:hypothetical protein
MQLRPARIQRRHNTCPHRRAHLFATDCTGDGPLVGTTLDCQIGPAPAELLGQQLGQGAALRGISRLRLCYTGDHVIRWRCLLGQTSSGIL